MTRVTWAPQAIQDVEAIRACVARDSTHYGDLVIERLVAAVERLKDSPHSGRVVPELGDDLIREIIVGNYRIITVSEVLEYLASGMTEEAILRLP